MFESALKKVVQNGQFALGQDESAPILSCLAFLFTPSQFEQQGTGLQTWNYRFFNCGFRGALAHRPEALPSTAVGMASGSCNILSFGFVERGDIPVHPGLSVGIVLPRDGGC
jgi:hypothetical protein